jgi:hypothetical protein
MQLHRAVACGLYAIVAHPGIPRMWPYACFGAGALLVWVCIDIASLMLSSSRYAALGCCQRCCY